MPITLIPPTPRFDFRQWIADNTRGCHTVVEFGSMFFERLGDVHPSVKQRIGIEIHQPYIEAARFHDCIKVQGDFANFDSLLLRSGIDIEQITVDHCTCAMFIDSLEHLEKLDALILMVAVQSCFRRILLMLPAGNQPQQRDRFRLGGDRYQKHRSTWQAEDVEAMGFQDVRLCEGFYKRNGTGRDRGCIFAVWNRDKER